MRKEKIEILLQRSIDGDESSYRAVAALPKEELIAYFESDLEATFKNLPEDIFGFGKGYDVRGNAQAVKGGAVNLTPANLYLIGKLLGTHYAEAGDKALITGDIRTHTPILRYAIALGVSSTGVDVDYAPDYITTGAHNLLSTENEGDYRLMVQVSGSHGIPEKNGFKIKTFLGKKDASGRMILEPLYAERLEKLYWKDKAGRIRETYIRKSPAGALKEVSGLEAYTVAMLDRTLPPMAKDEIVVIDTRAGTAGPIMSKLLAKRGFSFIDMDRVNKKNLISKIVRAWKARPKKGVFKLAVLLNIKPDGRMGRGIWDPSKPEALLDTQILVKSINSSLAEGMPRTIGAVLDGDGDRITAILEDGRGVPAFEMTLPYYQRFLLDKDNQQVMERLAKSGAKAVQVVCDVRANSKLLGLIDKVNKGKNILEGYFITTGYPPQLGFMRNRIKELDDFVSSKPELKADAAFMKKFAHFKNTYFTAEASGHNFFHISERYPDRVCDCAIAGFVTLLNIRETLTTPEVPRGRPREYLMDLFDNFSPAFSSNEVRVAIPNAVKIETVIAVGNWMKEKYKAELKPYKGPAAEDDYLKQPKDDGFVTVSGFKVQLADGRSGLVRWSNTGEELTTIFEGRDAKSLIGIMKDIAGRLKEEVPKGADLSALNKEIKRLESAEVARAIWERDAALWNGFPNNTGAKQAVNWMGWMRAAERFMPEAGRIKEIIGEVPYKNTVVLGTGGSGRGARTLSQVLGAKDLIVSYSPDGREVSEVLKKLKRRGGLANTLFIVASKSGTTTETATQEAIFRSMLDAMKSRAELKDEVKDHFIAITDEATPLDARRGDFRTVFINNHKKDNQEGKDIGGRFSAISYFGLVPLAATKEIDIEKFLKEALSETEEIDRAVKHQEIDSVIGFRLGDILSSFNAKGFDQVIQIPEKSTAPTGPWAEQLFNESLAKKEDAPLWVYGEPLLNEEEYYGKSVIFIKITIGNDKGIKVSELNGRPLVEVSFRNLGELILNLELAVTVWAYNIKINPFAQESVENSKNITRDVIKKLAAARDEKEAEKALSDSEALGQFLEGPDVPTRDRIKFYFAHKTAQIIEKGLRADSKTLTGASAKDIIRAFLSSAAGKDYIGIFAYTNEDDGLRGSFSKMREALKKNIPSHPTTLFDFGPGFHHSNNVAITCKDSLTLLITFENKEEDKLAIPGKPYDTDQLIRAMVVGELGSLEHGVNKELGTDIPVERRAMRVHIPSAYRNVLRRYICVVAAAMLLAAFAPFNAGASSPGTKIEYRVDSGNPVYAGFRKALSNIDASGYDNLAFRLRGNPKTGYTTVFRVELKNASAQTGYYYVTDIGDQWQETIIPLAKFKGITDLSNLTEIVIVFEDKFASNKKGVVYIDEIRFTKNK